MLQKKAIKSVANIQWFLSFGRQFLSDSNPVSPLTLSCYDKDILLGFSRIIWLQMQWLPLCSKEWKNNVPFQSLPGG